MSKTILVIEDNFEIREGVAEILSLAGDYEVLTAENGKIGVDMATTHLPDIILCDIMMPELDGYGVLYMLARNPATVNIPFIFLTAKSERADLRKAMEMGADDYLTKPFDDVELLNAIESRFRKREKLVASPHTRSLVSLSDDQQASLLNDLIKNARVKTYKKKHVIYEAGDNAHFIYYLLKGKVRSYLLYQDGRELSTDIYVENSFFGYEAVMRDSNYADNAAALEECEIALVPKEEFHAFFANKNSVTGKFFELLSKNIQEKEEQMLAFAYDTVRKRVAAALVSVAEKEISQTGDENITVRVSRDELAALSGAANETVSRMLADFKDSDLISKKGSSICIHSLNKLRDIKY